MSYKIFKNEYKDYKQFKFIASMLLYQKTYFRKIDFQKTLFRQKNEALFNEKSLDFSKIFIYIKRLLEIQAEIQHISVNLLKNY